MTTLDTADRSTSSLDNPPNNEQNAARWNIL